MKPEVYVNSGNVDNDNIVTLFFGAHYLVDLFGVKPV